MMKTMKKKHTRGETLVETIVSFAVVLMTLTMITAVVQLCIRLNNRAYENAAALEAAGAAVESGQSQGNQTGALAVTLPGYEQTPEKTIYLQYYLYKTDNGLLGWFKPNTTGGTGGG